MKRIYSTVTICTLLVLFTGFLPDVLAQENKIDNPDIRIEVNGLACPFCAYGIEKRLLKIESIEQLSVNLKEGTIDLKLKKKAVLSEEKIKKAVVEAGFEVQRVTYLNKKTKPKIDSDA